MNDELPPDPTGLRIEDGPWAVLAALASGDPVALERAKAEQREQFKAQFGCYPEAAVAICPECEDDKCPVWLSLLPRLKSDDDEVAWAARYELGERCTGNGA